MRPSKHLSVKVLGTVLVVLLWSGMAFAGGGPEPPPGATITGPEIWGVVVMNCENKVGTLRVKRVVDCNTETQAGMVSGWPVDTSNCPTQASQVEGFDIGQPIFGLPGTPFIYKAKNFKRDGFIFSFDAQLKFWLPAGP